MRVAVVLFSLVISCASVSAQDFAINVTDATGNNYNTPVNAFKRYVPPPTYNWHNTDLYQIWLRLDSICTPPSVVHPVYDWHNTDLYQIWLKLDSCFSGSAGDSTLPGWSLSGNLGTVAGTNFIGTNDNISWVIKTNATERARVLNTGNFGIGTTLPTATLHVTSADSTISSFAFKVFNNRVSALNNRLFEVYNSGQIWVGDSVNGTCFIGANSGLLNSGVNNTTLGASTLRNNSTGFDNIAIGYRSLSVNTSGNGNLAIGTESLLNSSTCVGNIAIGTSSLNTTIGSTNNTGVGTIALYATTSGNENVGVGAGAADANTSGSQNVAVGADALGLGNATGSGNTAIGYAAGYGGGSASYRTAIGWAAGYYESGANAIIIDNVFRANESDQRAKAPIYGTTSATVAGQYLYFNVGHLNLSGIIGNGSFANNAAALAGGLLAGDTYYTDVAGEYLLKIVH